MITFDEKTKTLIGCKCPDAEIEIDPVTPHLESYKKYLNYTIKDDIKDLARIIETICGLTDVSIDVKVINNDLDSKELKNTKSGYYSVLIDIQHRGIVNKNIPLMTLPYQDSYGVYTYPDGGRRALYSELTNLEDISIDREKNRLNIVLPKRSFSINKENVITKGFSFCIYKTSLGFQKIIKHYANMEEIVLPNLKQYFANASIIMALTDDNNLMPVTVQKEDAKVKFYDTMKSDAYKLGRLRKALNERLVIDYCLNKTLSREVYLSMDGVGIPAGTVVDKALLERFKKNLVNEVYCKTLPCIEGCALQRMAMVEVLKAGTEITSLVKGHLKSNNVKVNSSFLEEDLKIPMYFKAGTKITSEMIKLFSDSGMDNIYVKRPGTDSDPILVTFEQEYIGNMTTKYKYVSNPEDIPEGCSAEDYVLFNENGEIIYDESVQDNLTTYDLLALISYFARNINDENTGEAVNRDYDFLKKLNMANEIFSSVFYKTATAFVAKYRDKIKEALKVEDAINCRNRFIGFKDMWQHTLNSTKLSRISMDINTLTMYSQCLRAVVPVKSDRHVSKNMRMLTMFHDGRFCHYDSPAGRKIGLVCTLTLGCRVEDGILKVPRRHIQKNRLTSDVKYFTPDEELNFISSDALNMKIVDGVIQDTQVPARIPAITDENNRIRIGNVSASQVEYVNAFGEQNMSPTPAAVPFAGSDDSARLGFSTNLQNQTKALIYSEPPLVYTGIYESIYNIPNDYVIRAEADGVVTGIHKNYLILDYEETTYKESIYVDEVSDVLLSEWVFNTEFKEGFLLSEKPYKRAKYPGRILYYDSNRIEYEYTIKGGQKQVQLKETKILNETIMVMNIKVNIGDRFSRGDILVDTSISRDGIYSPGLNAFTVFLSNDGYNYEDAIGMDEDFSQLNTSISVHKEETKVSTSKYTAMVDKSKINTYVRKGDIISVIDRTAHNDLADKHKEKWRSSKYEGLVHSIEKCKDSYASDKTVKRYEAKIVGFNSVIEADKMAGRHGNKGVTGRIFKTSEMPMVKNGKPFHLTLNPHGVASRMNLGQLLELKTGLTAYLTGVRVKTNAFNGLSTYEVSVLVKFAHHCCNVYDMSKESDIRKAIAEFGDVLPESYIRYAATRHEVYKEWEGVFDEHGLAEIYDPVTNTFLEKKAAIGFSYFLKIKQEVDSKMHVRGGLLEDEPYSAKNYAPLQGASRRGGQANGEMEIMALLAHSANYLAHEYTSTKSDNYPRRFNLLSKAIGYKGDIFDERDCMNRSTMVLEYYLEVLGNKMDCLEFPELTQEYIADLRRYDKTHIADMFLKAKNAKAKKNITLNVGKSTGAIGEEDIIGANDSTVIRDIELLSHSKDTLEAEVAEVGIDTELDINLDGLDLGGDL